MKLYQLHLDGKDRAYHNFKTEDEALQHQSRLIRYIKDKINEGQVVFKKYLKEARQLEVVEIERRVNTRTYSVVEYGFRCSGIVKNFNNLKMAEQFLTSINEDSQRFFAIMESRVNDSSKNHTR